MARILGLLLVPFLLVGAIWLGSIIYLQQSDVSVDEQRLLLHFVYIPLAAVAVWFAIKASVSWFKREPVAETSPAAENAAPVAPPATVKEIPLAILGAEFTTPAGDSGEQLVPDLREGKLRPELRADLLDSNGLPVCCSRHADLDCDVHQDWLTNWLLGTGPEHPARLANADDGQRLLALLDAPLTRSLDTLSAIPPLPLPDNAPAGTQAPQRSLLIKLFAPAAWLDMLSAHIRERLADLQGFAVGFIKHDPQRPELHFDPIRVADAFAKDMSKQPAPAILMLIGCDSLTNQAQIDQLEAENRLFSTSHADGLVPGEAAAILLATQHSQVATESEPLARLERSAWGVRQKPVNARGRADADLLNQMLPELLTASSQTAAEVFCLSSDCDQRAAWFSEAALLMNTHLPELDPVADHLSIGQAFGYTGHAGPLLALIMAAHAVHLENQSAIAASMFDPIQRSLSVLRPWQVSAS